MNKKIRVLVVDDSAVMRQLLTEILGSDSGIEVVGTAPDPYVAREKIKLLNPDVLTLDVEMPRMDGLAFLRNLMRLRPMPVVMCSSLTQGGAAVALDALSLGAVDFVAKPAVDVSHGIRDAAQEIISKVKMAAHAQVRPLADRTALGVADRHDAGAVLPKRSAPTHFATTDRIIAIGASTGRHRSHQARFSRACRRTSRESSSRSTSRRPSAARSHCAWTPVRLLNVCEARDGQPILAGHAYIAPGDQHLLVVRDGARYQCRLNDGELVNRHRPSVDVLFRSVAQSAGPQFDRCHAHRHGARRRRGHEGNARSRGIDHRPGRKHQRRVGHAGRRLADRCGAIAASTACSIAGRIVELAGGHTRKRRHYKSQSG